MAEYKAIRGLTIRTIDGDASPLIAGDIWYNSSSKKIRGAKLVGAWAAGATSPATKQGGTGFGASASSAIMATGNLSPPNSITTNVQTYDGSAWAETADVNTGRKYLASAGASPQTAGLIFAGGLVPGPGTRYTINEEWNGTSWTELADANTARNDTQGSGTSTAALLFGGNTPTTIDQTEKWNGTSWTEVNDLNTVRASAGGVGITTASLCIGGGDPGILVELYNGTSWTETNDMNTAKNYLCSFGSSTSAVATAGAPYPSVSALTEKYDGTSWTELADLSTARWASFYDAGHDGTDGVITSGLAGDGTAVTEEWSEAVTASSFTSS